MRKPKKTQPAKPKSDGMPTLKDYVELLEKQVSLYREHIEKLLSKEKQMEEQAKRLMDKHVPLGQPLLNAADPTTEESGAHDCGFMIYDVIWQLGINKKGTRMKNRYGKDRIDFKMKDKQGNEYYFWKCPQGTSLVRIGFYDEDIPEFFSSHTN